MSSIIKICKSRDLVAKTKKQTKVIFMTFLPVFKNISFFLISVNRHVFMKLSFWSRWPVKFNSRRIWKLLCNFTIWTLNNLLRSCHRDLSIHRETISTASPNHGTAQFTTQGLGISWPRLAVSRGMISVIFSKMTLLSLNSIIVCMHDLAGKWIVCLLRSLCFFALCLAKCIILLFTSCKVVFLTQCQF